MRTKIFFIASFLSSYGMFLNLLTSIHELDKGNGPWLLLTSILAWIAYFRMGNAWINNKRLGVLWPTIGTFVAMLALNGGGVWFFSSTYKPEFILVPLFFVSPAVLMSIWLVQYHIKGKHNKMPNKQVKIVR